MSLLIAATIWKMKGSRKEGLRVTGRLMIKQNFIAFVGKLRNAGTGGAARFILYISNEIL